MMHAILGAAADYRRTLPKPRKAADRWDRFTGWKQYWAAHRWTQDEWNEWQAVRVPLPRSFRNKAEIVGEMLGLKSSMYTKLNGGDKQPSEPVQHIAMLAEVAAAVALGHKITPQIKAQADLLLRDRRAALIVIAYLVRTGQPLSDEIRDLAADAILLDETDRAIEEEESDLRGRR